MTVPTPQAETSPVLSVERLRAYYQMKYFGIDREVRAGGWPKPVGISLAEKTAAVVGFGDIGRNVARRMLASDMKVIAYDPVYVPAAGLEAVQTAAAYMHLHPEYRMALICTAELSGHFLDYDIQTVRDLRTKSAGLTVGNAAGCLLLRRTPWPGGGIRLLGIDTHTVPDHWHLCQVPVDGTLTSSSGRPGSPGSPT